MNYLFEKESYKIIGAAQEVHKVLGPGFLEKVYQDALKVEFNKKEIPFKREVQFRVEYKDEFLSSTYVADFVCYDKIIVEIKALDDLSSVHSAQVINYLKVTKYKLGLLINFGEKSLKTKRIIN